jgi:pimeloyl-ACP methyl ester carboxylesterase
MITTITLETYGLTLTASASGSIDQPTLLLLHGWPHSRSLYEGVLEPLSADFFVVAPDLPGIGESQDVMRSGEKTDIAKVLLTAVENVGAHHIIVAGLDVGGMIAFSAARDHGDHLRAAVIMNTVVPGIRPWPALIADPRIWHFAFHAVPNLPELLVGGRERGYFDFFHDALAGDPKRIPEQLRTDFANAYRRPEALQTGFDWYRAMASDAKQNTEPSAILTPLFYVRGDADKQAIEPYVEGLEGAGAAYVESHVIADCGELLPIEAPEAFVGLLKSWGASCCDDFGRR